jgi:haloalkane dehalogenase
MELLAANERYLAADPVPKLLLTCAPGILVTPPVADGCRATIANLEVEHLGAGIHYVQEDHPEQIGDRVKNRRRRTQAQRRT